MLELSQNTLSKLKLVFNGADLKEASDLLMSDCGNNLPFCDNDTPEDMERIRFAVLKLSNGTIEDLIKAIILAQTDWRDVLVEAGFADNINAHQLWNPGEND